MNVINLLKSLDSSRSVIDYSKLSSRVILSSVFTRRHQTTTASDSAERDHCKPFSAIPREKGLPYFGTFLKSIILSFLKTTQQFIIPMERAKKHGKIWREQPLPGKEFDAVYTVNPSDVQKVFRAEGKLPHRMNIPGLQDVRTASAGPEGELGVLFS